jgi:squalene synthase HpnC
MSLEHYENFPVASWLCPSALRPAVASLYWFARTADDLADEGEATPEQRLEDLAAYRADLVAVSQGRSSSGRWAHVFTPLARTLDAHRLPLPLLAALLSAFEQDVTKHQYVDRKELLDYCRRSANPVGRLLLHLYGVDDPGSFARSDAICTSLQLINFWQDLSVDLPRGRLYVPIADCVRAGVSPERLRAGEDSPDSRELVREMCVWARDTMQAGAPLALSLPGRIGWELRLVVQGGLRVLDKIASMGHASIRRRPRLRVLDAPVLLWRAAWMGQSAVSQAAR